MVHVGLCSRALSTISNFQALRIYARRCYCFIVSVQLKPRSAQGVSAAQQAASASAKSNPFGAAKPREQVLAEKGVDPKLVDSRIEKKAEVFHLTKVSVLLKV